MFEVGVAAAAQGRRRQRLLRRLWLVDDVAIDTARSVRLGLPAVKI